MLKDKIVFLVKLKVFNTVLREVFGAVLYDPATEISSNAPDCLFFDFILQYKYPLSQSFREKPFTAGTYFSPGNNDFCTLQVYFQ